MLAGLALRGAALSDSARAVPNGVSGMAGGLALIVPFGLERGGEVSRVRGHDRFELPHADRAVVSARSGLLVSVLQRWDDSVALLADGHDVAEQITSLSGIIQTGLGVGFDRPGSAQLVEHDLERTQLRVPGGLASGELGGVGGAEICPVAAEDH